VCRHRYSEAKLNIIIGQVFINEFIITYLFGLFSPKNMLIKPNFLNDINKKILKT